MRSQVKSAVRALELLELFARMKRPLPLHEISAALSYPQSSTTKLLKSIVDIGYLRYDRAGRTYFPTQKVFRLGDWLPSRINEETQRVIDHLYEATGETIILSIQNDIYVQYIKVIDSKHLLRFHLDEYAMRPLIDSSLGWMHMTTLDDDEINTIYHKSPAGCGKDLARNAGDLIRRVRECREQGFCYLRNTPVMAGGSISMLLPLSSPENLQMVCAVGGLCDRLDANLDFILREMRTTLNGVGHDLKL